MTNHTTPLNLDDIETRANAATPGPWCTDSWEIYQGTEYEPGLSMWIGETCRGTTSLEQDRADAEFVAAARTDVPALLAEVRRLSARVTELEGPAVDARAALAALCYDLDDPGTAALGALYVLQRATVGVDAPRDDAALALARHDAQVIRQAAQTLEATDRDDDAINLLHLLADDVERPEETHVVADDSSDPEHVDDCPGCEAFTLTGHRAAPAGDGQQQ